VPTNIRAIADFYVRNENDLTATGNDGSTSPLATRLANINPDIGFKAEAPATSDNGTFSLVQLLKRLLQHFTTLFGLLPSSLSSGHFRVSLQESPLLPAALTVSGNLKNALLESPLLPATLSNGSLRTSLQESPLLPATLTATGNMRVALQESSLLPSSLTASSNFKVALQESPLLPAALTASGNLKTSLQESPLLPPALTASNNLRVSLQELAFTGNLKTSLEASPILPTALTASGNFKVSLQELAFAGNLKTSLEASPILPAALTGAGNLKIALQESAVLPASLSASGNLKVAIAERSIPSALRWRDTAISATAKAVSAVPAKVYGWHFINLNTAPVFLHFYNLAAGSVNSGSTPFYTVAIPANGGDREVIQEAPQLDMNVAISVLATTSMTALSSPPLAINGVVFYL
jgi:hypothetical protein